MQWVQQHLEVVSPRVQDYHTFSDDWGSAWQYIKDLVKRVPGVDFDKFSSELKVAEEVYAVSATKKPRLPWDEDTYRDWEYEGKHFHHERSLKALSNQLTPLKLIGRVAHFRAFVRIKQGRVQAFKRLHCSSLKIKLKLSEPKLGS